MTNHRRQKSPLLLLPCCMIVAASLTMSVALFAGGDTASSAAQPNSAATQVAENSSEVEQRIQRAVEKFCLEDARETANYLLTEGTPDDVDLMEEVIGMLDTGEWEVSADIQATDEPEMRTADSAGGNGTWRINATCRWNTPVADLNGAYDIELDVTLTPDGQETVQRLLP